MVATLRVPSREKKSFWNIDTSVGFWTGSLIGDFFNPLTSLIMMGAGLLIGGRIGQNRIEEERQNGKLVAPPSFWNKSILIGLGIGSTVGSLLTWGSTGSLLALGGMLIGGIVGGKLGYQRQSREYEDAKEYVRQNGEFVPHIARGHAPVVQLQQASGISIQEAAQLEARLRAGDPSFVQDLHTQPEAVKQR